MGSLKTRKTIESVLSKLQSPNILAKLSHGPEYYVCEGGIKRSFIHKYWHKAPVYYKTKPK